MNAFQRAGSGVDLEPLIQNDMGLAHVEFRHAPVKPVTPPASRRKAQAWECAQGRGEYVAEAGQPTMEQVYTRLLVAVALVLVLLIGWHATARADTVGLHLASVHVPQREYSNANPGVFYRHDSGATVGIFRNSLGRTSVYGAYQFAVGPLDVAVGAVNGYKQKCWREEWTTREVLPTGGIAVTKGSTPKCQGTGRHEWMPMVVPSYAFASVGGIVPRVSVLVSERTTALHLSFEKEL